MQKATLWVAFLFCTYLSVYSTDKTVSPLILFRLLKFVFIPSLFIPQPVGWQVFHHINI
jgi:hypothetical protein